jgi:hypothetical protein
VLAVWGWGCAQAEIKRLRAAEAELKPRCATAEKRVKQLLAQVATLLQARRCWELRGESAAPPL